MEPESAAVPVSVTTATLPDEAKQAEAVDPSIDATDASGEISTVTARIAVFAAVSTTPAQFTAGEEDRLHWAQLVLARLLSWPVGSLLALFAGFALLAGPLAAAAGVVWAVLADGWAVIAGIELVHARQYGALAAPFSLLNTASRVMFASVSYFALLSALIVLMGGLLRRRNRRLYLPSGLLFTALALLGYLVSLLLLMALATTMGLRPVVFATFALYTLLDAILLAAILCDLRKEDAA